MNAYDILKYGNNTLMKTLERMPDTDWEVPSVCGYWSAKDVLAHLASYEAALVEILSDQLEKCPTPTLDQFIDLKINFNDDQVGRRKDRTLDEVMTEYKQAHDHSLTLVKQIPAQTLHQPGVLAWYGPDYSIDDFLVYTYYGHKREHSAQIAAFCDSHPKR